MLDCMPYILIHVMRSPGSVTEGLLLSRTSCCVSNPTHSPHSTILCCVGGTTVQFLGATASRQERGFVLAVSSFHVLRVSAKVPPPGMLPLTAQGHRSLIGDSKIAFQNVNDERMSVPRCRVWGFVLDVTHVSPKCQLRYAPAVP